MEESVNHQNNNKLTRSRFYERGMKLSKLENAFSRFSLHRSSKHFPFHDNFLNLKMKIYFDQLCQ